MNRYLALLTLSLCFSAQQSFSQDNGSIILKEKELKTKNNRQLESIKLGIKLLEKNPMTISQYVNLEEFKKIKLAIVNNKFEEYIAKVQPIVVKKKNNKGKIQTIRLEPDYVALENIGLGLIHFNNLENIQDLYIDLYEATPERERYQFLIPEKFNGLVLEAALVELKKLTSAQEKFQQLLEEERNSLKSLMTQAVPIPNCSAEVGFSSPSGDGANWCSSTDFHPDSLLRFSRMAMNSEVTCVKDQGARGTCVSFAINGALESRKTRQGSSRGKYNLSEQFTYFFGEVKSGSSRYSYGLNVGGALEDIKNDDQKIPTENQWRYNQSPDIAENRDSSNHYARSCNGYSGPMCTNFAFQGVERDLGWWQYEFLYPSMSFSNSTRLRSFSSISTFWSMTDALDYIISYVNDRKPVIASFSVRTNFMDTFNHGRVQTETFNKSLSSIQSNRTIGSHAAVIIGFVRNSSLPTGVPRANEKGYFIMKNSWGINNGDCGFYYVDYKYMRTYGQSFYKLSVR